MLSIASHPDFQIHRQIVCEEMAYIGHKSKHQTYIDLYKEFNKGTLKDFIIEHDQKIEYIYTFLDPEPIMSSTLSVNFSNETSEIKNFFNVCQKQYIKVIKFTQNSFNDRTLPLEFFLQFENLEHVIFNYSFDPSEMFELPSYIKNITFGGNYKDTCGFLKNQSKKYIKLEKISLGGDLNEPMENFPFIFLNKTLKEIKLSNKFNQPNLDLSQTNIEIIYFNHNYTHSDFKLPETIKEIHLGVNFTTTEHSILNLSLYKNLRLISLRTGLKHNLTDNTETKKFYKFSFSSLEVLDLRNFNENYCLDIYENIFIHPQSNSINYLYLYDDQFYHIKTLINSNLIDFNNFLYKVKNICLINKKEEKKSLLLSLSGSESLIKKVITLEEFKKEIKEDLTKRSLYVNEKILSEEKNLLTIIRDIEKENIILNNLISNPSLSCLITKNKKYNVNTFLGNYKKERNSVISEIHENYNGEFSKSREDLKKDCLSICDKEMLFPFKYFVNNPFWYEKINKFLRNNNIEELDEDCETNSENIFIEELVKNMKFSFYTKIPKLNDYLIVRKGLSHEFGTFIKNKSFPITIKEEGLFSTSLYIHPSFCYNQRKKNLSPTDKTRCYLLVLLIPPGIPCLDCYSNFNNNFEKEILLPPGITYEISGLIKNFKIKDEIIYNRVFLNKATLFPNEFKRRVKEDVKSLNDTFDILIGKVVSYE